MQIEKPVGGKITGIGKSFRELVLKELPIHSWCLEQKNKKRKIKL